MPEIKTSDVTIVGSGSWATAIAMVLTTNGKKVTWYFDRPEIFRHVRRYHQNPHYITSVKFDPDLIEPVDDINDAVRASEIIILVTPAAFLKAELEGLDDEAFTGKVVCTGIKGIVPVENTVVGEYLHMHYDIPYDDIVIITGPSHAEEVSMEKLTYLTFASPGRDRAESVAELFSNRWIMTIISGDIFGTEYAAVMKNIYAIAAGIAHGLGYGDNFIAVLLANATGEMRRFVEAVSPDNRDITDSPYLGDLLVTGYSQFSRNRALGHMIGKGISVSNALLEMTQVAEGYYASSCINEVNKQLGVDMPIANAVYRILYKNASPLQEIKSLTKRLR
ncbi:MAG: glycerol-3-phosphate dehydrogenase [Bacteroidales bacterium]|jgi:glycerol-3-phosphate dehydrogenase (NAD(P)+)|nr:glycerol-3-phosphate dehydrogenase [Bacteroidales bacterium]